VGTQAGANLRFALYPDDGSGTGAAATAPLAYTPSGVALANGPVETTSFTPESVSLQGGATYWLAIIANVEANIRSQADASVVGFSAPNTDGFPTNPTAWSALEDLPENETAFAIYIRVVDTE
jgi:hypothetical protein